ncbi:MAG: hypothetical protein RJA99_3157 [Pseudomonadota bacterium]|jgi:lysozyme family protein
MDFNEAFDRVIGHEGGYVNDPRDPGGETKFGISKRAYPSEDIKNLTLERARQLYRRDYWDRGGIQNLPPFARFDVFDVAVNSGISAAVRMLQRAVGVADDGVVGPKTLAAVGYTRPEIFRARFAAERLDFYASLPTWPAFGRGWARRVAANLRGV